MKRLMDIALAAVAVLLLLIPLVLVRSLAASTEVKR